MHAQKEQFVYDITSGEVPSVDAFRNLLVQGGISPTGNHVIVKRYVNENDSIGWHADKDGSFLPNYNIAVLTLGAERTIEFCQVEGGPVFSRTLAPGSLYVMPQELNRTWKHQAPAMRGRDAPSFALMLRSCSELPHHQLLTIINGSINKKVGKGSITPEEGAAAKARAAEVFGGQA